MRVCTPMLVSTKLIMLLTTLWLETVYTAKCWPFFVPTCCCAHVQMQQGHHYAIEHGTQCASKDLHKWPMWGVTQVVQSAPQTFQLSIEETLQPRTGFLIDHLGISTEGLAKIIVRSSSYPICAYATSHRQTQYLIDQFKPQTTFCLACNLDRFAWADLRGEILCVKHNRRAVSTNDMLLHKGLRVVVTTQVVMMDCDMQAAKRVDVHNSVHATANRLSDSQWNAP